ncbi:MAG: F0F1 ATP synthase subunit B, partial [Pseudomonadota bacterium]
MNINLTLIGQMLAFIAFVVFCMKYVWPPILAAMQEREQKIADGLAAADRASHDLELAQEKAVERLKEAKEEASGIVDAANRRANQIVDEAKDAAVVEADRVKAAAQAEIEQETNRAREQLRSQVAALSIAGAEKVLGAS